MRLIVAEDGAIFREGLVRLLGEAGFDVVGQVTNASALLSMVESVCPDVALVDIRMPPSYTSEGLIAALDIKARHPTIGVLVLSQYVASHHAIQLLTSCQGGVGYLLKDRVTDVDELVSAVTRVGQGGSVVDPLIVDQLVARQRPRHERTRQLTRRELEVLALMAEGRSNQAICQHLSLGSKTLESHVRSIFEKLELQAAPDDHRRVLAVLSYLGA